MDMESGLERKAEENMRSELRKAFWVSSKWSETTSCLRWVRLRRTEEHRTEEVTASQARGNCSREMATPMKMTRRGMAIGRTWAATSWPTGEEETGAGSGCFQLTASRMTRKQGSIQRRSPQLAALAEVLRVKR